MFWENSPKLISPDDRTSDMNDNNMITILKCIKKYNLAILKNNIIWRPAGTILSLHNNIYCWTQGFNYKTTGNFGFRLAHNTPMSVFLIRPHF